MVERQAVNLVVVGSSPTPRAKYACRLMVGLQFLELTMLVRVQPCIPFCYLQHNLHEQILCTDMK